MNTRDVENQRLQKEPALIVEGEEIVGTLGLFQVLREANRRPRPFEVITARELWTDDHTSAQMLKFHLNGEVDIASRRMSFIDRSAAWMISRFKLGKGKSVADFGCGPGLYTSRFAASEASVTGIDFSGRSLRYAREQSLSDGLAITYVQSNYLEFSSDERFDLITMIMCDYCALSPRDRQVLLGVFATHLRAGGAVLLDVYSQNAFAAREERATYEPNLLDGFWSSQPYYGFLNVFKYPAERVVVDKYTIVEEARIRVICNWLQYFDRETLRKEFEENGFVIEECLGNVAGDRLDSTSHEFAVVARLRDQGRSSADRAVRQPKGLGAQVPKRG